MNTTLKLSMAATAALLAGSLMTPAKAADLGGNCCADLEERIAELEATTVRKGTRKVSVTLSGFVGHQVMWWDDGTQRDMYIGDGGNYGSRFRFVGTAKINADWSAGFLYEFGVRNNDIANVNQLNGGDDLGGVGAPAFLRDTTVWMEHKTLGRVKVGHGSTATDNLVLIDLSMCGGACTPDVALYNGGFLLRANNGSFGTTGATAASSPNWAFAIRGHESWDTSRRNHVMYQSPTLHGFTLQTAVAEDNYWDIALRYAGELHGFRIAGGIGYQSDSEFNSPAQTIDGVFSVQCTGQCEVKTSEWKGALSVMHVASGLFATFSAGKRELDGNSTTAGTAYAGPDLTYWHLIAGMSQNFFGIGRTTLFGEYGESSGALAQAAYLGVMTGHNTTSDNDFTYWGLGVTQNIDAAAMEVFVTYKNYSLDASGFTGGFSVLNTGSAAGGAADFSSVMVGTRINF